MLLELLGVHKQEIHIVLFDGLALSLAECLVLRDNIVLLLLHDILEIGDEELHVL